MVINTFSGDAGRGLLDRVAEGGKFIVKFCTIRGFEVVVWKYAGKLYVSEGQFDWTKPILKEVDY